MNLLQLINVLELDKIVSLFLENFLRFIGIQGHDACNLFSNDPGNIFEFPNKNIKIIPGNLFNLIV